MGLLLNQLRGEPSVKSEYKLNDTLNLRELIESVTEHIKTFGATEAQPRTILGFLNTLLYDIPLSGGSAESWISTLQKVLSGNISYTKAEPLTKQILSGQLDDALLTNISSVTNVISGMPEERPFYQKLLQRVSLRFFSEKEKEILQNYFEQGNYSLFLLLLIKHSFTKLYNIPCFFAERIYEEALTYDYDSKLRFALMREAAINGNKNAALEYGNYLAKSGPYEEAFEYLLLAVPLLPAIWNLAFLIEKRWVGSEQARRFRMELKIDDKLASKENNDVLDEMDGITCYVSDHVRAEELLFVYKVYFYLANRGFYKAYNSMAKLLLNGVIRFSGDIEEEKSRTLCKKYLQAAIAGNNVTAMSNEGNRLFSLRKASDQFDPDSSEEKYMVELLSIGSEMEFMHACYYLGNYYEYAISHGQTNISRKDIKHIYERAAEMDLDGSGMSGQLYLRLGKLSDNKDEQINYYQRALSSGLSDAAYPLALCYCEMDVSDQKTHFLIKASKLLEDNLMFMTAETRGRAESLQAIITRKLNQ